MLVLLNDMFYILFWISWTRIKYNTIQYNNIHTMNKNTETFIDDIKEVDLEVNIGET
jgi:hypothetical protein